MHSEQELKNYCDQALALANGSEMEVSIGSEQNALTRFSESTITQNVASQGLDMSVRLLKDGRMGKASTGNLSAEGIGKCIDTARMALNVAENDPDLLPMPGPQTYQPKNKYFEQTLDLTPEARAEGVKRTVEAFQKDSLEGAGIFSSGGDAVGIANSNGLWAFNRSTNAQFSISAMSKDSSGWAEDGDSDIDQLRIAQMGEIAARKALDGRAPEAIDPGAYTVVFEPAAVADFLLFLAWDTLNGLAFVEDRSCFSGKVGEKVLGDNITLVDDAWHDLTTGQPFDFEGMPRQKVSLIENGVFRGTVHDRNTALKAGVESTGHAFPQPDAYGASPLNIVMSPGDSSLDEMIASTKDGVLVSRLHYTNILDPMKMMLTGMTRDGLFRIRDGKVAGGLKNMRFTDSVLRVFNNTVALSRDLSKTHTFWGGGGSVAPAIKVEGFQFTSHTEN